MPSVNDIVRNRLAGADASVGRVCHVGPITSCVQFDAGCLPVANADLVPANGNPPQCTPKCTSGKCSFRDLVSE
jgi:hypothetical protein